MHIEATNSLYWPKGMVERYRSQPTDPGEATWQCPEHGTIAPKGYEIDGIVHYVRQFCPCSERERRRKEEERQRRERIENQAKHTYSWLGERWADTSLRKKTFDNFAHQRQPEAYELTRLYAGNPQGTLMLYGTYGTGKTHLLAAICNEALHQHDRASLFTTAPELFGAIQQRIAHNEDYYALVERASKTPLLAIDDIDKSKWTEFREEIYFAIVDRRVKRELPTAISTNRLNDLGNFVGGAVCSRLQVGQIAIEMTGADYRKEL